MEYRRFPLDINNGLPFKLARTEFESSNALMNGKVAFEDRLAGVSEANFVVSDVPNDNVLLNHIYNNSTSRMAQMQDVVARQLVGMSYHDLSFNIPGPPLLMQKEGLCIVEGPFTKEQFVELNHQTLIYKYIMEGLKPPPALLIQLRNSVTVGNRIEANAYGASGVTLNLGGHNNSSSSVDPEPGRCRRTDGKKWRCAREVVPDHKYCERHINRGRHRPKKPANSVCVSTFPTGGVVDEHSHVDSISNSNGRSFLESDHPLASSTSSPTSFLQLPVQSTGLSGLGNKSFR